MARFTIPRDVYYGKGSIEQLAHMGARRALVVNGSRTLAANGSLARVLAELEKGGARTLVIDGIPADPGIGMVRSHAARVAAFAPDLIVGLGGGSPLDAAKAIWLFYEHPELSLEEVIVPFSLPALRSKARFVAVPTTSGTASEVTSFSVITNEETGYKHPIADFNLTPDCAIVDTDLAESMPATLTAHTGMDALTHAMEAYVSTMATMLTDALAMKAVECVSKHLVPSFEGHMDSRAAMHIGQCLAGMAFSNAILGIVHSMSHKSGHIFQIPHGCANAVYLPHCIRFNGAEAPEKYADMARRLNLRGEDDAALVEALAGWVEELNAALHIPATLKDFGISEDVFLQNLDHIAAEAVLDPCTGTNPRSVTAADMRDLFRLAYYGA